MLFTRHSTYESGFVLVLVLPPLLYSAALSTAYADFRDNPLPIGLLSVGLVLVTTVVVGFRRASRRARAAASGRARPRGDRRAA